MKLIKQIVPLLLLASLFPVAPARADLVIHRTKQTARYIGSEVELPLRGRGFILLDVDTRQGYSVVMATVQRQKIFSITTLANTRSYVVTGARGRTYTAFAASGQTNTPTAFQDRNQFSIGLNAGLAITPARIFTFPRAIQGTVGTVSIASGTVDPFLLEAKVTATYSQSDTRAANNAGDTLDQARDRIRATLLAQGYQEFSL